MLGPDYSPPYTLEFSAKQAKKVYYLLLALLQLKDNMLAKMKVYEHWRPPSKSHLDICTKCPITLWSFQYLFVDF